jgi:hypothetical protein
MAEPSASRWLVGIDAQCSWEVALGVTKWSLLVILRRLWRIR